jgi:dTDP-4-amino-4,6-dideoxygalactose transaminase
MGLVQLSRLPGLNKKRLENAAFLRKSLAGEGWLQLPYVAKGVRHVFHQFTLKVDGRKRQAFFDHLNGKGVGARIYYPVPVHMQPAYKTLGFREGICPVSESVSRQVISLPVHPLLKKQELKSVADAVKDFRGGL